MVPPLSLDRPPPTGPRALNPAWRNPLLGDEPESSAAARRRESGRGTPPHVARRDRERSSEHSRRRDSRDDRSRERERDHYRSKESRDRRYDRSRSRDRDHRRERDRSRSRSRDRRRESDRDRERDRRRDRSDSRSRSRDRDYRRRREYSESPRKVSHRVSSRRRSSSESSFSRSPSTSPPPLKPASPIKAPPPPPVPKLATPPRTPSPQRPAVPPTPEPLSVNREPIKISFNMNGKAAPPTGPRVTPAAFKAIPLSARARQPSPPHAPRSDRNVFAPAPPPPTAAPPPPPSPPPPSLPPKPVAPPAFHFRDLPKRVATPEHSPSPPPPPNRTPTPPPEEFVWPDLGPPACALPDPNRGNFRCLYDPLIEGAKASGNKGKERILRMDGIVRGVGAITTSDPREGLAETVRSKGIGNRKSRNGVYPVSYDWDKNSVGKKPQPPPTAVLLYGLNALTTTDQITKHLRALGRFTDIDVKLDPKSGMQLGICRVQFDSHEVAKAVVASCNGQRIGTGSELAKAVLDGTGDKMEKAVKAELARRYPPKPKVVAQPPPPPPPVESVPPPPPSLPAAPRAFVPPQRRFQPLLPPRPSPLPYRPQPSQPVRRFPALPMNANLPARPAQTQNLSQSFTSAPFDRDRRRRASSSVYTSDSESDDDRYYRDRYHRPAAKPKAKPEAVVTTEDVRPALLKNGYPHAIIDVKSLPIREATTDNVQTHFKAFKPVDVLLHTSGWYVLFGDGATAARAQRVLDKTTILSHRIGVSVGNPPSGLQAAAVPVPVVAEPEVDDGKGWKYLTFTKKNRPAKAAPAPMVAPAPVASASPSPVKKSKVLPAVAAESDSSSDDGLQAVLDMVKQRRGRKKLAAVVASESESEPEPERESEGEGEPDLEVISVSAPEPKIELEVVTEPVQKKAKVKAGKKAAAGKKAPAKKKGAVTVEIEVDAPTATATIPPPKPKAAPKKAKPVKAKAVVAAPNVLASSIFEDEEDVYFMRAAIEASRGAGLPALRTASPEQQAVVHKTGCARTEGYYKVPELHKSAYLPQRNRAAADVEAFGGQATSRSARVNTRRLVQGMEHHKKAVATDTDIFQFNQLRTRKKQLKFSKSPIHDWGLYAMEFIPPGEMVIEYVGELVRAQVAETREKLYEKVGIGSSYLFRVDDDAVVDATKKGNLGRLINHCCTPNCTAKIITINGEKKIVIYAKTTIEPGDEITYDYHFPIENEKIVCLCGSVKCRGFLN